MAWGVVAMLFGIILLGVPVGFALMITAAVSMWIADINLLMIPVQIYSGTNSLVLLAIPLFILMGELMSATSIAQRLIDLAASLVGWMRGGLSHINVVTSMFMAEMSGSAVADAAVMSKIFVPQMEERGYPKGFAASITAVSATLGIIIPPSIPMVLFGVTTNTSIRDLFIAGIYTPTEAAGIGVMIALLFGLFVTRDLDYRIIWKLMVTTARQTAVVMMIVAGSAILGQYLANEQLPQQIASALGGITDSYILNLLIINVFVLLLGMFLHASAAIIVVVPLLLPMAIDLGIDPVHFGVIVCLNLGIGQQTPPVASVLLTVCSTTGMKIEQVMGYCKWFLLAMFAVLLVVTFTPMTALWFR